MTNMVSTIPYLGVKTVQHNKKTIEQERQEAVEKFNKMLDDLAKTNTGEDAK